jgi:Na+/melibiose symporter-like transporter
MGLIYLVAMLCGAFGYRLPSPGWVPPGRKPPSQQSDMITKRQVHVSQAWKTPQFWLLWWVLCLNVSAGIGVIGMAAPMIQEVFKGTVSPSAAAGFAGLLSLFNIGGRIFWSSLSDFLGRQRTYSIFFALGILLYSAAPSAGKTGSVVLFVAIFCGILTMYGGAFATIPAYLSDLFGTRFVAATHGRLLTAWSTAGVLGPVLVNYIREYQIGRGIPRADAYNTTMYILSGLLLIGFFCNWAVKPVAERYYTTGEQLEAERRLELEARKQNSLNQTKPSPRSWVLATLAWLSVGVPLLWGIYQTLKLAWQIF